MVCSFEIESTRFYFLVERGNLKSTSQTISHHRLFKMAVQQGRSERRGEAYSVPYGEPLSDARTQSADFFNSLLAACHGSHDENRFGSRCHRIGQRGIR